VNFVVDSFPEFGSMSFRICFLWSL